MISMHSDPIFGPDDERALAMAIGIFFMSIIVGALIYFIVEPVATPMLDVAEAHTSRQSSAQGQAYIRSALNNAHLISVGFGSLWLIATAVYESKTGGGI